MVWKGLKTLEWSEQAEAQQLAMSTPQLAKSAAEEAFERHFAEDKASRAEEVQSAVKKQAGTLYHAHGVLRPDFLLVLPVFLGVLLPQTKGTEAACGGSCTAWFCP